jgi:hypothetical protein
MKRFTIDVPVELHRRVRAACAKRGLKTSSALRDLLEREFPGDVQAIPVATVIQDAGPWQTPLPADPASPQRARPALSLPQP